MTTPIIISVTFLLFVALATVGTVIVKNGQNLYMFASACLVLSWLNMVAFIDNLTYCMSQQTWLDKLMGKTLHLNSLGYLFATFIVVSTVWSLLTILTIVRNNVK